MTEKRETPIIPADGIEFELALTTVDPMQMVRDSGHDPRGWRFSGLQVIPQIRRFQLVRVDHGQNLTYSSNLGEVREKLKKHGDIPEGQWREAFKQTFPCYDGNGPIGFADHSWTFPGGGACFPALFGVGTGWSSDLIWANNCHSNRWRWLVAIE